MLKIYCSRDQLPWNFFTQRIFFRIKEPTLFFQIIPFRSPHLFDEKKKVIKQDKGDDNFHFQVNYYFDAHNIPYIKSS